MSEHKTSVTLLEKLRQPGNQPSWDRFVKLYAPLLHFWIRRKFAVNDQDSSDLVQEIFLILLAEIPKFQYNPGKKFRAWLWTITKRKCLERLRRAVPEYALDQEQLQDLAISDAANALEEQEYQDYVVKRAMQLIQQDFEPLTWQAFWLCTTTDQSADEIAAKLGLGIASVYAAKSRVLRRLRHDLDGLLS